MAEPRIAWRYWMAALVLFLVVVWVLGDVLLPFVAGMAIAYFLDPIADWLERHGFPRWLAATTVLSVFTILILALALLLVPLLHGQLVGFSNRLPGYLATLRETVLPAVTDLAARFGFDLAEDARSAVSDAARGGLDIAGRLLQRLWSGGLALVSILSMLVITPVVAFYLLRDYDHIVAKIDSWLPRQQASTIRRLLKQIDDVMAGFIRGQGTVCLLLATFYAVG